jgi:hypothetical protein
VLPTFADRTRNYRKRQPAYTIRPATRSSWSAAPLQVLDMPFKVPQAELGSDTFATPSTRNIPRRTKAELYAALTTRGCRPIAPMPFHTRYHPLAQKTIVQLVDDLDGTTAKDITTVTFGLDGVTYEIDLTRNNAAKLRNRPADFVDAARPTGGRVKRSATPIGTTPSSNREQTKGHPRLGQAEWPQVVRPRSHPGERHRGVRVCARCSVEVGVRYAPVGVLALQDDAGYPDPGLSAVKIDRLSASLWPSDRVQRPPPWSHLQGWTFRSVAT